MIASSNRGRKSYRRAACSTLEATIESPKQGAVKAWSQSSLTISRCPSRSYTECGTAR